jgi:hypothetical protein
MPDAPREIDVVYLATLQFSVGGLFDGEPLSNRVHLIRGTHRGTPGPTLCGIERMQRDENGKLIGPGFSVGGGIIDSRVTYECCRDCAETARRDFSGVPVAGARPFSDVCAAAVGAEGYGHSCDVPARRDHDARRRAEREAARAHA